MPINQAVLVEIVTTIIFYDGALLPMGEVGKPWAVSHFCNEIPILLPRENMPE